MEHKKIYTQAFCVVGAVLEKDGKFLLVKEGWENIDAGKWNWPAGWLDLGENPIEAVKREVKEETGLNFEPTGLVGIYSHFNNTRSRGPKHTHSVKLIFCGKITSGDLIKENTEIVGAGWFTPEEIYDMDSERLRSPQIKTGIRDFINGRAFPLDVIRHEVN